MGIGNFLPCVLGSAGDKVSLLSISYSKEEGIVRDTSNSEDDNVTPAAAAAAVTSGTKRRGGHDEGGERPTKRRRKQSRPLRLGVDISQFIWNAIYYCSADLGDDRHLTNHGRADLAREDQDRQEQRRKEKEEEYIARCTDIVLTRFRKLQDQIANANILVVFDGKSPPIKSPTSKKRREERRKYQNQRDQPLIDPNADPTEANAERGRAFRRSGADGEQYAAIQSQLQHVLRQLQIPFLVAPYEADGQLAYLSDKGYIDSILTEDSDLIAHGCKSILYKTDVPNGTAILLQFGDIGAASGLNLVDFTPIMMTTLFACLDNDYIEKKLSNIGPITACEIVRKAFLSESRIGKQSHSRKNSYDCDDDEIGQSPLELVLEGLFERCTERDLTEDRRQKYEERFLSALVMYRHPIVYDPIERKCIYRRSVTTKTTTAGNDGVALDGDFELINYEPYSLLCNDIERVSKIVGEIPDGTNHTAVAEGRANLRDYRRPAVNDDDDNLEERTGQQAEDEKKRAAVPTEQEVAANNNDENHYETNTKLVESEKKRPELPIEQEADGDEAPSEVDKNGDVRGGNDYRDEARLETQPETTPPEVHKSPPRPTVLLMRREKPRNCPTEKQDASDHTTVSSIPEDGDIFEFPG